MTARFNSSLGGTGCLDGHFWYYGLDHNEMAQIDLLAVAAPRDGARARVRHLRRTAPRGALFSGYPDVFSKFMLRPDHRAPLGRGDGRPARGLRDQHLQAAVGRPRDPLHGPLTLQYGRAVLRVNAPSAIAGDMAVGTANFGPALFSPGVTGDVVLAVDGIAPTSDACTALTNGAAGGRQDRHRGPRHLQLRRQGQGLPGRRRDRRDRGGQRGRLSARGPGRHRHHHHHPLGARDAGGRDHAQGADRERAERHAA